MTAQVPDPVKELTARTCAHAKVLGALAGDAKVQMAFGYLCLLVLVVYLVASYIGELSFNRIDAEKHLTLGEALQFLFFSLPILPLLAVVLTYVFRERAANAILNGASRVNGLVEKSCFFIDMFFPNNRVSNALSKWSSEFKKLSGEDENCVEAPAVQADEEQPVVDP